MMTKFMFFIAMCCGFCTTALHAEIETHTYVKAMEDLDNALKLSRSIKDPEEKMMIFDQLQGLNISLKKCYIEGDHSKFCDISTSFYENMGEVLAECNEVELRNKIAFWITQMMDELDICS